MRSFHKSWHLPLWPLLALWLLMPRAARGQVLHLGEMNTTQIAALDRAHTVLILTNGIVEEHGPLLPTYTDGYVDEAFAADLARTIVARPGWSVVLFPVIPLGTNAANDIGLRANFPGSFTIQPHTLRDVFFDLADSIGAQGFRHVLIVDSHGGPANSLALDQASDYFHATYGGHMTHLFGLMPVQEAPHALETMLTPAQQAENGMEVHAGALEQSLLLFLQPALVPAGYRNAPSVPGADFATMTRAAARPDWPGYLGAPRYATAAIGALAYQQTLEVMRKLVADILDGKLDPSTLPRYGDIASEMTGTIEQARFAEAARMASQHAAWLAAHPNPHMP